MGDGGTDLAMDELENGNRSFILVKPLKPFEFFPER